MLWSKRSETSLNVLCGYALIYYWENKKKIWWHTCTLRFPDSIMQMQVKVFLTKFKLGLSNCTPSNSDHVVFHTFKSPPPFRILLSVWTCAATGCDSKSIGGEHKVFFCIFFWNFSLFPTQSSFDSLLFQEWKDFHDLTFFSYKKWCSVRTCVTCSALSLLKGHYVEIFLIYVYFFSFWPQTFLPSKQVW